MNLYEQFVLRTYQTMDGLIPMHPITTPLLVGDFAQIRNGQVRVLGNIQSLIGARGKVLAPFDVQPEERRFSHGAQKQTTVGSLEQFQELPEHHQIDTSSVESILFESCGSFAFWSNGTQTSYLLNWNSIKEQALLALTIQQYSFRDVFVVTQVTQLSDWVLALAELPDAKLKYQRHFIERSDQSIGSDDSEHHVVGEGVRLFKSKSQAACFFKAKKLTTSDVKYDEFLNRNIELLKKDTPQPLFAHRMNASVISQAGKYQLYASQFLDLEDVGHQEEKFKPDLSTYFGFFDWTPFTLGDALQLC